MTAASPLARYRAVDGALPSGSAAPSYTITGDTTELPEWAAVRDAPDVAGLDFNGGATSVRALLD